MTTAERETQRADALKLANERRVEAAEIKREIRAMSKTDGMRHVAMLLETPTDAVEAMRVGWLLESIRGMGPSKVAVILNRPEIRASYDRRVRDLSFRQCVEIAKVLRYLA